MLGAVVIRIASINRSGVRELTFQGQPVKTGIFKEPVAGEVRIGRLGLYGDVQVDKRYHGGPDRAVYVYSADHYPVWEKELGRSGFTHGLFGENLTVEGLTEETMCVGDIFRCGTALIQATEPRQPCYKMATKIGIPSFPKTMTASGRLGCYFRVVEEGTAEAGQPFNLADPDPSQVKLSELIRLLFHEVRESDVEFMDRIAEIRGLSDGLRHMISRRFGVE